MLWLNEFMARPGQDWDGDGEATAWDEYIEVWNRSGQAVALEGLWLDDTEGGSRPYGLGGWLEAGEMRVYYRSGTGVALNDEGDEVRLLAGEMVLDAVRYEGVGRDEGWSRDEGGSWQAGWPPSPGEPNVPPTPTPTVTSSATPFTAPSATPTASITATPSPENELSATASLTPAVTTTLTGTPPATTTPTVASIPAGLRLNEFLPRPASDWNGDGVVQPDDEYIEVINAGRAAISLQGISLDDSEGGSTPFQLSGTLEPGEIRVYYRSQTGVALNDTGDEVRLIASGETLLERQSFASAREDESWQRGADGMWYEGGAPSPGAPNNPPPSATPIASGTPTPHPASPTPSIPYSPALSATPTLPGSPSPSSTPGITPTTTPAASGTVVNVTSLPLVISEVLYAGTMAGQGDEYVEIWNPSSEEADLTGWRIGDEETRGGNEGMYLLDGLTLAPGSAVVIARDAAAYRERFARWPVAAFRGSPDPTVAPLLARDTSWSGGHWALTDSGDEVVLLAPDGIVVDRIAYREGAYEALGITGRNISAPAPLALHHVGTLHSTHMNDVLARDEPTPGKPYLLPDAPAVPAGPELGGLRVAWGSLHERSSYSDGSGPPELAYAVARANGFHFMALTDDSQYFQGGDRDRVVAVAREVSQPGAFLALVGFQWAHSGGGQTTVLLTADDASFTPPGGETIESFYQWLATHPGALATFSQPLPGDFNDFVVDPAITSHVVGIEVAGGIPPRRFEEGFWKALEAGWRVGSQANPHTPNARWGADSSLRTGVLLPELTEDALYDALHARRTFATEDANLALALRAGEVWMGGEITGGQATLTIVASDGEHEPVRLEVQRNGETVATHDSGEASGVQEWRVTLELAAGDILVARAVQVDGDMAWSGPLTVTANGATTDPRLTEILPAPLEVDWDGDGEATFRDEWIEIYNPAEVALTLGGWRIERDRGGYTFPASARLAPGQYMVLHRRESGLALSNEADTIRLLAPGGREVDVVEVSFPGYDLSMAWCDGQWRKGVEPSPGAPCTPPTEEEHGVPMPAGSATPGGAPTPSASSSGGANGAVDVAGPPAFLPETGGESGYRAR